MKTEVSGNLTERRSPDDVAVTLDTRVQPDGGREFTAVPVQPHSEARRSTTRDADFLQAVTDSIAYLPPWVVGVAGAVLILIICAIDFATGPNVSLSIFYLIPIGTVAWFAGPRLGMTMALGSAVAWLAADVATSDHSQSPMVHVWNAWVRLGFFLITVYLLTRLKRAQRLVTEDLDERTALLSAEIRQHQRAEAELKQCALEERERIALGLHDGVCQFLTGIAFKSKTLEDSLRAEAPQHAAEAQRIVQLINEATAQVRSAIQGLVPTELSGSDLLASLRKVAADAEELFHLKCAVNCDQATVAVSAPVGLHLIRIAQEAVHNIVRHAHAHQIALNVSAKDSGVTMSITDDGRGFRVTANLHKGLGLRSMRHRAKLIGGTLIIDSAPDRGTTISCVVPHVFATAKGGNPDLV